uniref:Uncharacterized protein n=1 Tax=Solanum lycopersicum TaxID=4081 RepID=A0A3Q7F973_SOLLC
MVTPPDFFNSLSKVLVVECDFLELWPIGNNFSSHPQRIGMTEIVMEDLPEKVIPEIGYQLLHNYADQIQNRYWTCNVHSQASRSCTRDLNLFHKQPTSVTPLADREVTSTIMKDELRFRILGNKDTPVGTFQLHLGGCFGVNLTDVDLLEFLQQ